MSTSNAGFTRRIAALPYDSEARLEVLKLFRCYSLATALVLLEQADAGERSALEEALNNIFEHALQT